MNEQAPEGVRADPPSGVERLIAHVKTMAPVRTAVVHPCDALSLGGALDARDAYTASHSDRVADMVLVLAAALGLRLDIVLS